MKAGDTQAVVIGAIAALIATLCAIVVLVADRGASADRKAGVARVPPPDSSLAYARLSGNPGLFFGPEAYPEEAIERGQQGLVRTRLTVAPTGAVSRCIVTASSGVASLDRATCDIALERVRYTPARDGQGRAIESEASLPVRWVLPDQ